ncbi:MAG: phosphoserine phosphatase [bacterium]|nr:MAG: phosphoserine phosphatase [bacterium]
MINHNILTRFINTCGNKSPGYQKDKKPVAVFDWDDTCIFNDIGEATFRFQAYNLRFKLSFHEFSSKLPDQVNGHSTITYDSQSVSLKDLKADLLADYSVLLPLINEAKLEHAKKTAEYRDFIVKLPFIYDGLYNSEGLGPKFAYPWVVRFLANHTRDDVKNLAKETFSKETTESVEEITLTSPDMGRAGQVKHLRKKGIRIQPFIIDLMKALRENGFDVFVVTASQEAIVQGVAEENGYDVPNDHVFGIRLQVKDNRLTDEVIDTSDYPINYRKGKVTVIKNCLPRNPVFIAGDSNSDYTMLTAFPETALRLIINRNLKGDMALLYQKALQDKEHYILLNRDEDRGIFISC